METSVMWWKKALVYQIYPLSFKDSNDDGVGDIKGIISKLDYLKAYGVDVIWLSPVYESPMDDNGYDIADYQRINPMFGTMDDMKELIQKVHDRGMKLVMDLVLNHTSDEHAWFKEARSSKNAKYRNYYLWSEKPEPPISSIFSGPAWTYNEATDDYYFHLFSKRQPDLNWQNPHLRKALYRMINWWLDLGIDGFRMDVIELIGKDIQSGRLGDGPFLETYLKEMYEACFKGRDIFNVGEMGGISAKRAQELTSTKETSLHMAFQFDHMSIDHMEGQSKWHLQALDWLQLKKVFIRNHEIFKDAGWHALFLSNHDQPRMVSRFGNVDQRRQSSQMLFTMMYLQKGTPFVYQGEEIGMTGIRFKTIDDYRDIETKNWYDEAKSLGWKEQDIMASIYAKSRDNSRTPMQWNDQAHAGFTGGNPWMQVNPNYHEVNVVKEMSYSQSIYHYTKRLFEIRKKHDVFTKGTFKSLYNEDPHTFIYLREDENESVLVVNNLTDQEVVVDLKQFQSYQALLMNENIQLSSKTQLKPYASGVFMKGVRSK